VSIALGIALSRRGGFPGDLLWVVANEFGPQPAELAAAQ